MTGVQGEKAREEGERELLSSPLPTPIIFFPFHFSMFRFHYLSSIIRIWSVRIRSSRVILEMLSKLLKLTEVLFLLILKNNNIYYAFLTKRGVKMAGYRPSYLFRFYIPRRSNNMQQGVQTDATCYIKQCWKLLANNVASVYMGLN